MKKTTTTLVLAIILLVGNVVHSYAIPAYPFPVKITQSDGTTITVIKKGNNRFHFDTTTDGHIIIKNKKGIYEYAQANKTGNLYPTGVKANDKIKRQKAEKQYISTLDPLPSFQKKAKMQCVAQHPDQNEDEHHHPMEKYPKVGNPKSLIILVNYSDIGFSIQDAQKEFQALLNQKGYSKNGGTGSAKDYFIDNSMGTFSPQFDVVGPYTLPQKREYYGGNNSEDNDKNPIQMIVDACTVASQDGIDFAQYDTDDDGYIDNVFVYYAGHNEAEHGGEETIWPHKWSIFSTSQYRNGNYKGSIESITFNGKIVRNYACTSELRGNAGQNMCGIGTFTHEFGHVLGLPDYYSTNGTDHHTLSLWDVMDEGPYLNQGRTPPSYSGFERFELGFMTPKILKNPKNIILSPLSTSNEAYLISSSDRHNLVGTNPIPTEFFILENRQNIGWDKYLPGHGMLVFRINYNKKTWEENGPNNDPDAMGVDIIEADGIASKGSLSGDPFPGTSQKTSYTPALRNGTKLTEKSITFIREEDNTIFFKYDGGTNSPTVKTDGQINEFITEEQSNSNSQVISILGNKLIGDINLSLKYGTHFQIKLSSDPDTKWGNTIRLRQKDSIVEKTNIDIRYKPLNITCKGNKHNDGIVIKSLDTKSLSIPLIGTATKKITITTPTDIKATATDKQIYIQWSKVPDAIGYYITVTQKNKDKSTTDIVKDKWVSQTNDTIYNLVANRTYLIQVQASDLNKSCGYENKTPYSTPLKIQTEPYPDDKKLRVLVKNNTLNVYVPHQTNDNTPMTVNVFNTLGEKIKSITTTDDILEIHDLPKKNIFIVQSGTYLTKIIIN